MITAVANMKGGVGKTTLTVHLAAYLSEQGARVVVVDGDPQGNATSWLLGGETSPGVYRLLIGRVPAHDVIRMGKWGVALIPGNDETGDAMTMLASVDKLQQIRDAMRPLTNLADYVLIDMPPSRAAGFEELLAASRWVIVPTQLERLSLEGVTFMAHTARKLQQRNEQNPRLLGIVPNMARRTIEHREQLKELVETFGPTVWTPIPQSVRVSEACGYGDVMYHHAPDHKVTKALSRIGARFIENTEAP